MSVGEKREKQSEHDMAGRVMARARLRSSPPYMKGQDITILSATASDTGG